MKRLILITLLITKFVAADAQTWREWTKQGKTQRRYLLKQLALLKTSIVQIKKGVSIARRGLATFRNARSGEFNLHKDFFSHLDNVNPVIENTAKVADIVAYQVFILRQLNEVNRYCRSNKHFTAEEVRYVADVYANMLVLCDANLAELLFIVKPNKTGMTDDERLARIDFLYDDMHDKRAFVKSFEQDVYYIALNRAHEHNQSAGLAVVQGLQAID